ncbi:MAG: DNA-binding response regulator [Microbacterium sp.]|uniref:DNA-binding response regulator n=1 Tax=Microbacterium ginsengisoli TaxID=400772 RepID=A0A0F0LVX0_9MICO|nr:response regulator transcription factor [Microbacterium ginsengisoli]KJL35581.1 Transcriptional regulatory protein LiaR [Microbacterium ginsengisoli]MAL06691.1 DNA-binding response regulator [Microbacterium sp.]MBN9207990.1 response regulator transcription factor [Microbacterium ginsengisoli]HAN23119.1 DNA-binding response regulator [Microbacterium ginsengisoli]
MIRVATIDDHESVRLGVEAACSRDAMIDVVFSGSGVRDYRRWLRDSGADPVQVALLDITLGDGTTVSENIQSLQSDGSEVVIYSVADRLVAVREALAAGAAGVISKSAPMDDIVDAVRTVAAGEPLNNIEWASAVAGDSAFGDAQLSAREREALALYAAGLPLKLVAQRLGITYNTAKENISRIRAKYIEVGRPAPTKIDLRQRAVEDGVIDPDAVVSGARS